MVQARFELNGEALVVTPMIRSLDASSAASFLEAAREHVRGRALVVVSLACVDAVDASGVGALLAILKAMPPGGVLRLAHARRPVRTLLETTFLDELLPAFDDLSAALRA
jgi:anti-sigma B factor antagonist